MVSIRAGSHWEISPAESKQLADAIGKVGRHYPIMASQKSADWAQLLVVVATLAVPRAIHSYDLAQSQQQNRRSGAVAASPITPAATASTAAPATSRNGQAPEWRPETPSQLDPAAMASSHATAL